MMSFMGAVLLGWALTLHVMGLIAGPGQDRYHYFLLAGTFMIAAVIALK